MQKGFSLIIPILIISGFLAVMFIPRLFSNTQQSVSSPFPSPTPSDETTNWKTYMNETYKYEFKYPSSWSLVAPSQSHIEIYDRPNITEPEFYDGDQIVVTVSKPDTDGVQITDPIGTKKEIADKVFQEKIEDVKLGNLSAAKFYLDVSPESATNARLTLSIRANLNADILIISFNSPTRDKQEFQKRILIFEKFIKTFKFLQ